MATEISVRISRNPHGCPGSRFEARFAWNGMLYRYQFDERDELAYLMVMDKVHPEVRDEVMGAVENYEWDRTFPLGVVYVGEAACDSPIDEPVYPPGSVGHEMQRYQPSYNRDWEAAIVARTGRKFWKWIAGFMSLAFGLTLISLFVVLSRR